MTYSVKEIFYTLQGEGIRVGRPAIFCRFSGCNLWNGLEKNRSTAICNFCDTNFIDMPNKKIKKFKTAIELAETIKQYWPSYCSINKYLVFTGGEPLLQLDLKLINQIHSIGFEIAVETNGTIIPPEGIDWLCVSPKIGAELKVKKGNELKVIIPQKMQNILDYENLDFKYFLLQPMDNINLAENIKLAIKMVKRNPKWQLSIQTHKVLNIL